MEANPPLIVDPDTVLTRTIALKCFKPILAENAGTPALRPLHDQEHYILALQLCDVVPYSSAG